MKYIANLVEVDAYQIVHVGDADNDGSLYVGFGDGRTAKVTGEMLSRMKPKPADYYVVQSDGYIYLNPKEVFERKYTKAVRGSDGKWYPITAQNIPG
jgi:hypothetical protein